MKRYPFLVTLLLLCGIVSAQSNLRGLFVNLNGQATNFRYEDDDWSGGSMGYGGDVKLGIGTGGATFFIGTGLTRVTGDGATRFAEDYSLRATELGLRLQFGDRTVVPYVELAGRYVTSEPYEGMRTRAAGGALAPGLLVFLSEHVALDARARLGATYVYAVEFPGAAVAGSGDGYPYASAGLHLGLTFYPSVRRARYRFERGGGHL